MFNNSCFATLLKLHFAMDILLSSERLLLYREYQTMNHNWYNFNHFRWISILRISVAGMTHFTGECFFSSLHLKRIKFWSIVKLLSSVYLKKRWKFKTTLIWNMGYEFSIILFYPSILLNSFMSETVII